MNDYLPPSFSLLGFLGNGLRRLLSFSALLWRSLKCNKKSFGKNRVKRLGKNRVKRLFCDLIPHIFVVDIR
jgi:hypothetical protein